MNVHRTFLTHSLTPYRQAPIETVHKLTVKITSKQNDPQPTRVANVGEQGRWGWSIPWPSQQSKPNTDGYWSASGIRAGSFQQPALMLREMGRTNKASTAKANPGRLLISGPKHSLIHLRGGVWRMSTRLLFSPPASWRKLALVEEGN